MWQARQCDKVIQNEQSQLCSSLNYYQNNVIQFVARVVGLGLQNCAAGGGRGDYRQDSLGCEIDDHRHSMIVIHIPLIEARRLSLSLGSSS